MTNTPQPPAPIATPWEDSPGLSASNRRAIQTLRSLPNPEILGSKAQQRVWTRLAGPRQLATKPFFRPVTALAAAAVLSLAIGAAAALRIVSNRARQLRAPSPAAAAPVDSTGADVTKLETRSAFSPQNPAAPAIASHPKRSTGAHSRRSKGLPQPATEDPLARETTMLGNALTRLRVQGDVEGALSALAEYRQAFPGGLLRDEARLAEIDADLRLGRSEDALRVLEDVRREGSEDFPLAAELGLVRAELLAKFGRCPAAATGLTEAVGPRELRARALFARASCALSGNAAEARSLLRAYLEEFPDGADAPACRRALGELPAP